MGFFSFPIEICGTNDILAIEKIEYVAQWEAVCGAIRCYWPNKALTIYN